jgi:hypothetical protein
MSLPLFMREISDPYPDCLFSSRLLASVKRGGSGFSAKNECGTSTAKVYPLFLAERKKCLNIYHTTQQYSIYLTKEICEEVVRSVADAEF